MPETYNGFYLKESEIADHVTRKPRLPVFDEHDRSKLVGEVFDWVVGEEGEMIVAIEIPEDNDQQRETASRIRSGEYKGLSLGCRHNLDKATKEVLSSTAMEISVCEEGDIEGTEICTFHSKDGRHSDPFQIKWEPIKGLHVLSEAEESRLRTDTVETFASSTGPFEYMASQLEEQLRKVSAEVQSTSVDLSGQLTELITMTPDGLAPDIQPYSNGA